MRVLVCVACRCELDQMAVGNGRALVICVACESVGNADEIAQGARLTGFDKVVAARRPISPSRPAAPRRRSGSR